MPSHYNKTKPGPAPTRPMPHGEGQGPLPGDHTLPPLKLAKVKGKSKISGKYGSPFNADIA